MLVHDSRILQVTLFEMLQSNVSALDFSLLLPDVMTIADEVDSQLTQAMDSYMNVALKRRQRSYSAAIKPGKDNEDMDCDCQHGQTSRPRVGP